MTHALTLTDAQASIIYMALDKAGFVDDNGNATSDTIKDVLLNIQDIHLLVLLAHLNNPLSMSTLTQDQLKKWYNDNIAYLDKPRKVVMTEEDYEFERERISYDRCVSYFERDRDDYIRQGEFTYSNPISI